MAITTPPTITALPDAPVRGDRATFRAKAEAFVSALSVFRTQLSAVGSNVYSNAGETYTNSVTATTAAATATSAASDAVAARDIAQSAGNVQGSWTGLTGSLSPGDSVSHNGRLWVAITNIVDVTASEPSASNSDWIALTAASYSDVSKSAGYTAVANDDHKIITCTAAFTLAFEPASNLGVGWSCYVKNVGSGNVILNPDGSETIDGVSTGTVEPGDMFFVRSDGTNLKCEKIAGYKPHHIVSSQTWTCPAGVRTIFVQLCGGGGSGLSSSNTSYSYYGGSGAGYSEKKISVSAGVSKVITIGSGGTSPAASSDASYNGSTTSFSTDCSATGGVGGTASAPTIGGYGIGGDINMRGGSPPGYDSGVYSGGGGSYFGPGMSGITGSSASETYGVGGHSCKSPKSGQAGAGGICIIWY